MKILFKYKTKEYLGEYIIIPADEDLFNDRALMSLNSFGYSILELTKKDITEEELLNQLDCQFDGDKEELKKAFFDFRDRLVRKQLIK